MTEQSEPMPGPQQIPAAFQQNGHTPPQMALALMQQMPHMLASALASVLTQVTVRTTGLRCAGCVLGRAAWIAAHPKEAETAEAAYMQAVAEAAAAPDDDPRKVIPLTFTMFLPEHLRPGKPNGFPAISEGTTMLNGAVWCTAHMPGAPGKTQLLVASAAMSPSMFAA